MKHQLQTIREALNLALNSLLSEATKYEHPLIMQALTALAELERMAGEPVAWTSQIEIDWAKRNPGRAGSFYAVKEGPSSLPLYAVAPPAQQQYEAGDMASAHNDGFRAGVASVAQQPQARPDFTDEWTGYLKDGETPFERFLRERKDLSALTKLYQRALEENERLKAQQPQAECRSDGRCQYAIDHGAEGLGHCPEGKCAMKQPQAEVAEVFYCKTCGTAMQMPHDDCLACERGERQQPQAEHPPCKGLNCGITRADQEHSPECIAEAARIQGWTETDQLEPQPEAVPELTDSQIMASIGRNAGGQDTSISANRPLGQQWTEICALVRHIIRERYCGVTPQQPQAEAHKPLFTDLIDKHPGLREELLDMEKQQQQALADALYALQVPHVACQDGLVTRCMCRKCVIKRGDEALAASQQAEAVPKELLKYEAPALASEYDGFICDMALQHGAAMLNDEGSVYAFTQEQLLAFTKANRAAPQQAEAVPPDPRPVIEMCAKALAEELAAWDIDPPLHHVKEASDACEAWLAAQG